MLEAMMSSCCILALLIPAASYFASRLGPQTPKGTGGSIGTINISRRRDRQPTNRAAVGIIYVENAGRAVPGNIHAPVIAGCNPGKDVVVQNTVRRSGGINLNRRRPGVTL